MSRCPSESSLLRAADLSDGSDRFPTLDSHLQQCERCRDILEQARPLGSDPWPLPEGHVLTPPEIPGLELWKGLGSGGMGVVFKARHKTLDREVAVKLLPPVQYGASGHNWQGRAVREARLLAKAKHIHVIEIYDVGIVGDRLYLVMEYAEGGTLSTRVQEYGPFPSRSAAGLVASIARAVEAAHRRGSSIEI
ncbi:MAG: protein kinase [Isosphaeraceae bacterium]